MKFVFVFRFDYFVGCDLDFCVILEKSIVQKKIQERNYDRQNVRFDVSELDNFILSQGIVLRFSKFYKFCDYLDNFEDLEFRKELNVKLMKFIF